MKEIKVEDINAKMNSVKKETLNKQDELNRLITEYQELCDELNNK